MVTRCGGAGEGGCCANAAGAKLAMATAPNAAQRLRHVKPAGGEWVRAEPVRTATALVIDDHTPGNTADRDGNDWLAALGIDDGDVVAEAVGDKEPGLVARERDAP